MKNNFLLIFDSVDDDDPDVPKNFTKTTLQNVVRGKITSMFYFSRLPFQQCKLTMISRADIKGNIPKQLANRGLSSVLESVRRAYEYFERDDEIDKLTRKG